MSKITTAVTAARARWQSSHDARIENTAGSWTIEYNADIRPDWTNAATMTYKPGSTFTRLVYNGIGATYRSNKIEPPVRQLRVGPRITTMCSSRAILRCIRRIRAANRSGH